MGLHLPHIHFDSHTLGNLVKNVSPALAFTPLGLAGVAGASALGDLGRGKHNLLDIAKGAAGNVAIGAGGRGVAGHFGVLGQGGAPAVGELPGAHAAGVGAPDASPITSASDLTHGPSAMPGLSDVNAARNVSSGPLSSVAGGVSSAGPEIGEAGYTAPGTAGASGGGGGFLSTLGKVGSSALDHDKTTAALLNGVGSIGTMGAQNRAQNAQARLLEQQTQQNDYDYNRKKAQDLAMEPLRQALLGRIAGIGSNTNVAPDPYLPKVA